MDYPKMMYRSESKYLNPAELMQDLNNKRIRTITAMSQDHEQRIRSEGFVCLNELLKEPPAAHDLSAPPAIASNEYPKMLYRGLNIRPESLKDALRDGSLKTAVANSDGQEEFLRQEGYTDLKSMFEESGAETRSEKTNETEKVVVKTVGEIVADPDTDENQEAPRQKRKYTRRLKNVGSDSA